MTPKALQQKQIETAETRNEEPPRVPLTRIFSLALFSIVGVFIMVTLLAYSRLIDFRAILSEITQQSVPNMVFSAQIYNQVNSLTYLTEGLSKSSSEAARLVTERQINTQLRALHALADEDLADSHVKTQLLALQTEISELNQLVIKRLDNQQTYKQRQDEVYRIYDAILSHSDNSRWTLIVADIVALAGKATHQTRLHAIRQTAEEIRNKLSMLETESQKLPLHYQLQAKNFNQKLSDALLNENGVIALRAEQLRIDGRARGRGNFVRNLILDYANLAEFQSYKINEAVITQTGETEQRVNQQIRLIGIASVSAVLFLLSMVFFVQRRFVRRLNHLNIRVQRRLEGFESSIKITGNDEISDISETFDMFVHKVEHQNQILHNLSLSDGLTGIANRRALDEKLKQMFELAQRHQWPISVMLMDVDFFKAYNDHYGHAKGDECLINVASVLSKQMKRSGDFVARYGGEEFACILPDTPLEGAETLANAILQAMDQQSIYHGHSSVADHVTLSIGIVTCYAQQRDCQEPGELLKRADHALYKAKSQGRNRYECFEH